AGLCQGGWKVGFVARQGAGDAVGDRARLPARAAADDLDRHVELALGAGHTKRRESRHLEHTTAEVSQRVLVVHRDPALAWRQANAGDGVLAPAGAAVQRFSW